MPSATCGAPSSRPSSSSRLSASSARRRSSCASPKTTTTSRAAESRATAWSTAGGSPTGSTRTLSVSVRQATEDDAETIERVRYETWQATYRGLMPDALLDRMTPNVGARRERLRAQPPDHSCFVAEAGGAVVGFAFGGPERAKDPDYRGEVYAIYVLPAFQGRGRGRGRRSRAAPDPAAVPRRPRGRPRTSGA